MQNDIRVMQVLRVPPLGKLVVEVNQQRYETAADLADEHVRRLLLMAIGELVDFAGGYAKLVEVGASPPLVQPADPAPASAAATSRELEKKQSAFLASLEAERDRMKTAPLGREPSVLGRLRPPPVSETPAVTRELDIVSQIDAILQRLVTADPNLAERSIHLVQNPSGGLLIEVDGVRFQRPAEIREPRIQIHIKRALKEWGGS